MTIAELLAATGLTANDRVPIYDAEAAQNVEPTQKITAAQLAAAVKVLSSLVNTTEMNAAIQQSTANLIKYETHSFTNISFEAGTAGSRGAQYSFTFTAGTIVGITIIRIEDSSVMIPVPFVYYPDTVYLNVYRASGGATSNNRVDIRIAYI